MKEEKARQKAKERVEELKGFYKHLTIYTIVNAILLLINLVNSPDQLWFYWPVLGWGIGLVSHAVQVFNLAAPFFKNWENEKIEELTDKYKDQE